jgi:glutamine amidotransferase
MCELLGMSASVPTDISFSFAGLIRRGGATGPHRDGWGIAFYDGKGCRSFHDPAASAESPLAKFLAHYPIKSEIVISHIRKANRGRVALENTHPFIREMWGRYRCFAHNGQLRGVNALPLDGFLPVGTTDSEHAFCWMLGQLAARWSKPPAERPLRAAIADLAGEIAGRGVFNMMMSDSRSLFCHRSTHLSWITRRAPFKAATLLDEDLTVDFAKHTSPTDVVTIVATRPLTGDETWMEMPKGKLVAFRDGELHQG